MRRFAFALAILLALSAAAPALAAGPRPPLVSELGRDFLTGARYYEATVGGWMRGLLSILGFFQKAGDALKDQSCSQTTRCAEGLTCLNFCDGNGCVHFEKRCEPAPKTVLVLGAGSPCDTGNLCADGTACVRVCPAGLTCDVSTRCVPPAIPGDACAADTDCKAACAKLPYPPIGPAAYVARCASKRCACDPVSIIANAPRVACPGTAVSALVCPTGTAPACTPSTACASGACDPVRTCLAAPEYGGSCANDAECAAASCPAGAQPFCGEDQKCKCRRAVTEKISCATAADCGSAGCAPDELMACVSGACACAPAGATTSCKTVSDCSANCPENYEPACNDNRCVCQHTAENVPVACKSVADCGAVACPSGYDKGCLNAVCACSRTVPAPY